MLRDTSKRKTIDNGKSSPAGRAGARFGNTPSSSPDSSDSTSELSRSSCGALNRSFAKKKKSKASSPSDRIALIRAGIIRAGLIRLVTPPMAARPSAPVQP
eukprot:1756952-Amphidinium_carterae.1